MRKVQKLSKVSINILLLPIDILLLILLTKNINNNLISLYINARLLILCFSPLVTIFKLMKSTTIIIKESRVFNFILSHEENILSIDNIYKTFSNIFIFYAQCLILLSLFIYSMDKIKYLLASSNNLSIFIAVTSLNFILVLINTYIDTRCHSVIDLLKEKKV